jgi:hypothetical protein
MVYCPPLKNIRRGILITLYLPANLGVSVHVQFAELNSPLIAFSQLRKSDPV